MKFIYHPDGVIYNTKGYMCTYAEFVAAYPDCPLVEGEYFEYNSPIYNSIDNAGHNFSQDPKQYQAIIDNIESLGI